MDEYKILKKNRLAENVIELTIHAPLITRHAQAGQFVILRVDADGERVPFTISDFSRDDGSVGIIVQTVGYSTFKLATLEEGDYVHDIVGPLGNPTDLSGYDKICLIGGGIGAAVIYPQAKKLFGEGAPADVILGARTKGLLLKEEQFKAYASTLVTVTDDGSAGRQGFVTDVLKDMLSRTRYDCVFAVGPLRMMQAVAKLTLSYGVKTVISMNSLMVDGTGMCGCCRLSVGGKIKYACIDGPEFDASLVDFDEAIARSATYRQQEAEHLCRLRGAL